MGTDGGYKRCFFEPCVLDLALIWMIGMSFVSVTEVWGALLEYSVLVWYCNKRRVGLRVDR